MVVVGVSPISVCVGGEKDHDICCTTFHQYFFCDRCFSISFLHKIVAVLGFSDYDDFSLLASYWTNGSAPFS